MSDNLPGVIILALMACAVSVYLWSLLRRIRRRGGVAGVLVGSDIERTVDRVEAHGAGMSSGEMRVHRFADASPDRSVGLELVLRTRASYSSMTAALSAAQARDLAALIRRGIGEAGEASPRPRRAARDGPV